MHVVPMHQSELEACGARQECCVQHSSPQHLHGLDTEALPPTARPNAAEDANLMNL